MIKTPTLETERFIGTGTLEHRSGDNEIEKWEVTKAAWTKLRKKEEKSA